MADLGYRTERIGLGKVFLEETLDRDSLAKVETFLRATGFETASDRNLRIVDQVKEIVRQAFTGGTELGTKPRFSSIISGKLHMNYDSISELFTSVEGTTLEKYIIFQRLEKVKELLVYSDLTLTHIAHLTGFSSIHHLSRQFKELTGLPPSHFKAIRKEKANASAASEDQALKR